MVILRILLYIAIFLGLVFLTVKRIEHTHIFFPSKELELAPQDLNFSFKEANVSVKEKVILHGWFFPLEGAKDTLLFLHGNAGNISHRLEKIAILRKTGTNIFIIDYRGYGKSSGKPSEKGLYADALAAYRYLTEELFIAPRNIILYGESLGAAVAVNLAAQTEVKALILEGSFSSARDIGKKLYPYLPMCFASDLFNSLEKIRKIKAPKLFFHSPDDEIVPFALGRKLYAAASGPKQFKALKGGHNWAFADSSGVYLQEIIKFLESL